MGVPGELRLADGGKVVDQLATQRSVGYKAAAAAGPPVAVHRRTGLTPDRGRVELEELEQRRGGVDLGLGRVRQVDVKVLRAVGICLVRTDRNRKI